ncbi:hypothetical protein PFICI_10151 [Pestalotiopsis fici W106-1]|uniref:F-box domain-containing protein n=1 Tax=Pestalotiopsis fici (strain W106-1 / CGMCC3.15140) TaxID=1229662 RepID=W3WWA4_PESFW|nr:uncharacterized protein PFICI_10151 [Pestalotiopsis fici W106-1]ETS78089.1 hypothetical protein PFICI_10151 [Pestalotiopsis fici W106-1]
MPLNLSSLSLEAHARLENLPLDILLIIFSYLDTAKSVASLGVTCKKLHNVVRADGWRTFVRSHFKTLSLPQEIVADDDAWMHCARDLTCHSRSWDRRAFSVASFVAPTKRQQPHRHAAGRGGHGHGHGSHAHPGARTQTIPPHIVVAAHSTFQGQRELETVAWGAGEDVVLRSRVLGRASPISESWLTMEGARTGFSSGKDDVTAISILGDAGADQSLLVGRASGHLHLISAREADFGRSIASFCPQATEDEAASIQQRDLQDFAINEKKDSVAVVTKDNALLYSLNDFPIASTNGDDTSNVVVAPREALDMRNMEGSRQFRLLRTVKFMGNGDLVVGMTGSPEPLRYITRTPTGLDMLNAPKLRPSPRCSESYIYNDRDLQNVRGLLPISPSAIAGGFGNVILSSYDDGTIRLQDLRSSSAIDTIYQDHFEVMTPVGPLLSHGLERFIAGSARTSSLKIFDFRWTKGYNYTEALPCSERPLEPLPKPPTMIDCPSHMATRRCNHRLGLSCNRHALARTDFYRPNCNLYLPVINQYASPIYSLAKPSDLSSNIYAGLAGQLVRVGLRGNIDFMISENTLERVNFKRDHAGYSYHESSISIIETGDGLALNDISKSQRVPEIRKQSRAPTRPISKAGKYRLDLLLV